MWHILAGSSQNLYHSAGPSGNEFVAHYGNLAQAPNSESFDNTFENDALEFLIKYDTKCLNEPIRDQL